MGTEMKKTIDQRRAEHAWNKIEALGKGSGAKDYAREAKKLPMRIMAAGLGQAMAFILAKAGDKKSLKQLHADISEWALKKRGLPGKHQNSILKSVIEGDTEFLRRATDEIMAYLQWLNRFAEAKGLTDDGSDETRK